MGLLLEALSKTKTLIFLLLNYLAANDSPLSFSRTFLQVKKAGLFKFCHFSGFSLHPMTGQCRDINAQLPCLASDNSEEATSSITTDRID